MPGSLLKNNASYHKSNVTLKDIAKLAGCSVGTASAVVNKAKSNTRISPQTRRQILEVATKAGYRPHFAAQSLVRQSSRTIGVYIARMVTNDFGNGSYDSRLLRGLEKACIESGLKVEKATQPSRVIVLADAAWNSGGWYGSQFWSMGEIGFYHKDGKVVSSNWYGEICDGSTNMLLLDGHADSAFASDIGDMDTYSGLPFSVQAFPGG
jgi:prepilin-type processing-associated H-X9-DG protein